LLRSVRDRWAPHLKLQLLAELYDQALKLTVKFAVLSLQIGSLLLSRVIGGRLSASVCDRRLLCLTFSKLLLDLCNQALKATDLSLQIGSPILGIITLPLVLRDVRGRRDSSWDRRR
jgi:hypothetical protein